MKVNVLDFEKNKVVEEIHLDEGIFGLPVRDDILHRYVQWQLAKKQAGTHKTKGVSEISGTTRKPWKQKGTGRARQGSLRSPQFRGGAVIFGPVVRSHAYNLNKKFRKLALKHALSTKYLGQSIKVVDSLNLKEIKTKVLKDQLAKLEIKNALFVDVNKNDSFSKACANLIGIDIIPVVGLNVYDILRHDHLVITKDALAGIMERLNDN
ncbi:MAG: 50S ribosomal protein L4 [Sphingobacteriia bacterium]|nr:50S ribosomal protein L4 [Sphingobacteriia bacterium]